MNFYGLGLDRGRDMDFNGVHDVREILESLEITLDWLKRITSDHYFFYFSLQDFLKSHVIGANNKNRYYRL